MKSTSESLSHPETSSGKAAEGNCVVARRGGEQPEADLWSQTKVNPIRFTPAASLLGKGEACCMSGNRFLRQSSSKGEKRGGVDGWGENAGKVSCGSVESCPGRNPRERNRAAVRAVIVVMKRSNSRGAKGGRKWSQQQKGNAHTTVRQLPTGLERQSQSASGSPNRVGGLEQATATLSSWAAWKSVVPVSGGNPATDESANPRLESRVREICMHGSEGGAGQINAPFLPLSGGGKALRFNSPEGAHF